ncbi:hypothetical protein HHI36_005720 [Cryptolaemus montrouzieri]|uniref:BRCT domain-containing protein n=1 Tax=Cryptolaemus montrouzieri TaxID=559131 RepID=A0ABD2NV79_9CUCU
MQDIPGQLSKSDVAHKEPRGVARQLDHETSESVDTSSVASVAGTRQEELPNSKKKSFPSITESNVEAPQEMDKAINIDDDSYNVMLSRQRAVMRDLIYMEKDTISDCTRNAYNAGKFRNEVDGESPSANWKTVTRRKKKVGPTLNIGNERMEHHDGIMGNERNNDGQNDDVVDDRITKDFTSPNVRVNAGKNGKWRYLTTSKGIQNQNSRPAPIRRNKEGASGLKTTEQKWLFVSGLSTDTTPEDIIKFVQDSGKDGCTCEKIKTRKERKYNYFRLGVPRGEKIYHIGCWILASRDNSE